LTIVVEPPTLPSLLIMPAGEKSSFPDGGDFPTSANGILFNVAVPAVLSELFLGRDGDLSSNMIGISRSSGLKVLVIAEAVLLFLGSLREGEDKGLANCAGIAGTAGALSTAEGIYSKAMPLFSNGVVMRFHHPRER
jgi:hypothetical protein